MKFIIKNIFLNDHKTFIIKEEVLLIESSIIVHTTVSSFIERKLIMERERKKNNYL